MTAGQMVQHVVVIHNTGNVRLRGVDISTTLSRASVPVLTSYICTGGDNTTLPSSLNVSITMTCTADYTFANVTDIEAGDLNFTASVQATDLGAVVTAQPEIQMLRVINAPSVQLTLNASACDSPRVYSKCPYRHGWVDRLLSLQQLRNCPPSYTACVETQRTCSPHTSRAAALCLLQMTCKPALKP
jgi:hypothetical protein